MSPGVSGPMLLTRIAGANLPAGATTATLPNTGGYAPGSVLDLMALNLLTGGHDVIGQLVVSADGKTMTSIGPIALGSASSTATSSPTGADDLYEWATPAAAALSGGSGGGSGGPPGVRPPVPLRS